MEKEKDPSRGPWIKTYSGLHFYPLDPRTEDICIEDIAHALSHQCRFSGHTKKFFSVASHSLYVTDLVERGGFQTASVFAGLMHDASEAYLVDVPKPIKPRLRGYKDMEDSVSRAICRRWNIVHPWPEEVYEADLRAMYAEGRDLMGGTKDWDCLGLTGIVNDSDPVVIPATPMAAKKMFLERFYSLKKKIGGEL